MSEELIAQIKRHEGFRETAYKDTVGVWTIGFGTNLEQLTIDQHTAEKWLFKELDAVIDELVKTVPDIVKLNQARKDVLFNMAYNMGVPRLMKFVKMWEAIFNNDWDLASKEMLDSKWSQQVGKRSTELAEQMRTGNYVT